MKALTVMQNSERTRRKHLNKRRHMKTFSAAFVAVLLASGCAQKGGGMKPHYEAATRELDKAAAVRPDTRQPDLVSQALLPPLVIQMPPSGGRPPEARFDLSVNNAPAAEVLIKSVAGGSTCTNLVQDESDSKENSPPIINVYLEYMMLAFICF
jgi:hypothetical protein